VVEKFESIRSIDPNLASAKTGLEQARLRAELHEKLDYQINRSDRFNEDKIAQQAQQVLASARSVDHGGPVLTGQVDQLARLLEISAIPVPVSFESDNLTEVVLYKVGSLGTFLTRTLELKPGGYVAVGHRDGYRDVRRSFRVVADGNMQAIVLRCEEPI
jgi:hypothetical protein